jgi:peroxidase
VYASVNDIDLYIGGLIEIPMKGASVGPIVSCLMAEQFSSLKKSDRFYYERTGQRASFTAGKFFIYLILLTNIDFFKKSSFFF